MPSAFETELEKDLASCATLTTSLKSIATNLKTHTNNFDKANDMYYASADHQKELAEKLPKNLSLAPELKKWQDNHPKLATRVKSEFAELTKVRAGIAQADKVAITLRTSYNKLNGGAAKAALDDVNAFHSDLKTFNTNLTADEKEVTRLKNALANYDVTLVLK
jgi:DNA repair exonuclease SbcCD ATPase subunit